MIKPLKKFLSLLLSVIMLTGITAGLDLSAYAATSGGFQYTVLKDGTAEITGHSDSDTVIEIPSELDGYTVTSIGVWAFFGCSNYTKVIIPDSVTNIGYSAFEGCTSLTEITIPDSVTSIGKYLFSFCESLEDVTIGNSVTSIGDYTFYECTSLTNVTIGNSVTSIDYGAFYVCTSLTEIIIPNGVTSIGKLAFYGCTSLTEITIPDSVSYIGEEAFYGCDDLTIYGYEGSYAQTYANENDIPFVALTSLADETTGVVIMETADNVLPEDAEIVVEQISSSEDSVIYDITLLQNGEEIQPGRAVTVKIPVPENMDGTYCKVYGQEEDGTYTNMYAAYQNGYMVFTTDNFSVYVLAMERSSGVSISDFEYTVHEDGTVEITKYNGTDAVVKIPYEIKGYTVTSVKGFYSNDFIEEVWIPNSVTSLGNAVFYDCSNLKLVVIGSGLESIPEDAFKLCYALEKIVISETVVTIPRRVFFDVSRKAIIYGYKETEAENYTKGTDDISIFYVLPDITDDNELELYYSLENTIVDEVIYALYLHFNVESISVADRDGNLIEDIEQSVTPGMTFTVVEWDGSILTFSIPDIILGDVTGDGIIDAADVVMVQRYDAGLITLSAEQLEAADVTGDGIVDAADVVMIQRYDAGLISSL